MRILWILYGLLSQGDITVLVVTSQACIWSRFEGQGLQPPSPRGGRGCLRGRVRATIEPRFLLLLKPAITVPSGNSLLLRGSRYRVALLLLMMAAISGFRGSHSVTRTNFFCPVLRPRRGRFIKFSRFCRAGPKHLNDVC